MSLRIRLFLVLGSLVALLVLAQWWWVRGLTRELTAELDEVAFSVGHSVASYLLRGPAAAAEGHAVVMDCGEEPCEGIRRLEVLELDVDENETLLLPGQRPGAVMIESDHGTTENVRVVRRVERFQASGHGAPEPGETPPDEDEAPHGWTLAEEAHRLRHRLGEHPPEGEPVIEKTGVIAYKFNFTSEPTAAPHLPTEAMPHAVVAEGESESAEAVVKVHLEHQDSGHFLWMAGPTIDQRFQIPQEGLHEKLESFSQRLVLGSVGFLALGLLLAAGIAHHVTTPLRRLSAAAREVGGGALGTQVPVAAGGEVGQAISAFNSMSGRLAELDARTRELSARQHLGEIGEIARGLAHTLRNPLNALGLSLEELAVRAGDGETATGLAESARRQIRRIDGSIRSFLALASQSGGVVGEVDLAELLQDVTLEALQDSRGGVRLEVDAAPGVAPLSAVAPELRAVFQALVVNAVEASPPGATVTVRLREAAAGGALLEVEDEGPGLPEEVRQKLFTPHLTTKANGSGMGLFLAHRIATTRYRGRLELADRDGGGTRAVLELAARRGEAAEESGDE